jgi:hypothetical protein
LTISIGPRAGGIFGGRGFLIVAVRQDAGRPGVGQAAFRGCLLHKGREGAAEEQIVLKGVGGSHRGVALAMAARAVAHPMA